MINFYYTSIRVYGIVYIYKYMKKKDNIYCELLYKFSIHFSQKQETERKSLQKKLKLKGFTNRAYIQKNIHIIYIQSSFSKMFLFSL